MSNSKLMKMKRLVDGDDFFAGRVEAACWLEDVEYTHSVLLHVAGDDDVLASAKIADQTVDTIDSSEVLDEDIQNAVRSYRAGL